MERQAAEYVSLIEKFFDYLEHHPVSQDTATDLMVYLMNLYAKGLELTVPQEDLICLGTEANYKLPSIHIKCPDAFWLVFYPFENEEPVCASMYDCFNDICKDLLDGLQIYGEGKISDAILDWKCSLDHWGRHVVEVLMALHSLRTGAIQPPSL